MLTKAQLQAEAQNLEERLKEFREQLNNYKEVTIETASVGDTLADQRLGMQHLALFVWYLQANDAYLEAIGTDTEYAKGFARKNALAACLEAGFDPVPPIRIGGVCHAHSLGH